MKIFLITIHVVGLLALSIFLGQILSTSNFLIAWGLVTLSGIITPILYKHIGIL